MRVPRPDLRAALVLALATTTAAAAAQDARTACRGQVISGVVAIPLGPLEQTAQPAYEAPLHFLNSPHTVTRPEVVLSLILLKVGDHCNEFQRLESERILRAQPFIANARIAVVEEFVA